MTKENVYKILDDKIEFGFYSLFFSSLHKNNVLTLDRINAVDLNTSPHSIIIDKREIIFLNHNDTNSLESFAVKNKIPLSTHFDTWAILTRDYLDTQLEEQKINEQNEKLNSIGIDQSKFKVISKGLWWTMAGTMEWAYLGLWDVFAMKQYRNPLYRLYGKGYYWKLMAIGLKGSEYEN
ncbi:MAG: hypothetical protein K9H61_13890 [Bacteroidia bacterium]|nr:hypothetical protein [Bacteroidia bacterium]MCF8448077.1 hypothetical protein [Bacteroidia bacterium]